MKVSVELVGDRWVVEGAEFSPEGGDVFDIPDATFVHWMQIQASFDGMQHELTQMVYERNHGHDRG